MRSLTPVAAELCAGGGGLSTGIVGAGFRLGAAAEIDEDVAAVHAANHPSTHHFAGPAGDIRSLKGSQLLSAAGVRRGELSVLAGGVPCQGFSSNGLRDVYDPRNSLWKEAVRLADETAPRAVVIENVPGMATLAEGAFLEALISSLEDRHYGVTVLRLDAADYGVAQRRQRLFIVALANGSKITAPPPAKDRPTVWDAIADLPEAPKGFTDAVPYARDATSPYARLLRHGSKSARDCQIVDHAEFLVKRFSQMRQGDKDPPTRHRRLHARRPSHTLLAGAKTITACRPIHPFRDRVLTVREGARLFGYPDTYRFPDSVQRSWYVMGNSVPPPFAQALFKHLRAALA